MQVRYCLPTVAAHVDDHSVTALGQALLFGDLLGRQQQPPQQRLVFRPGLREGRQWLDGDDEYVRRGLRVDVADGHDVLVPMDERGGDLSVDDSGEESFLRHVL